MKKAVIPILFFLLFINPCFAKTEGKVYEKKQGALTNYKDTSFNFTTCNFAVRLSKDYKSLTMRYQSGINNKECSFTCDNYVEILTIVKVEEHLFWFSCEALGFSQLFVWDLNENKIYEPFFDMKNDVYISRIDYENQVLFGDTWNSDKGLMQDQKVELYLFSTYTQSNFKIAEKYGNTFKITLLENNKIQYDDNKGNLVQFDYSNWIRQDISYTASSFLIERTATYGAENLSSANGLPWASANGYGINDTIQIKTKSKNGFQLVLYNGYQSSTRPDLYKANSRVKKIQIKDYESGNTKTFTLQDIQDKQTISLNDLKIKSNSNVTLEITILEVYQGEKYKDLCIQAIIPVFF